MTDPPRRSEPRSDSGIPRWVKTVGIALAVVVLLVVAMMLVGGTGGHGPSRHGGGDATPGSSVSDSGGPGAHTPPEGGHG